MYKPPDIAGMNPFTGYLISVVDLKCIKSCNKLLNLSFRMMHLTKKSTLTCIYFIFVLDIDTSAGEFGLEEYISVITCGESVGILEPFTNDFVKIRNAVGTDNDFVLSSHLHVMCPIIPCGS